MRVIAVLPARNEAPRIGEVIGGIKKIRAVSKIIVVDDASSDNTADAASRAGARAVRLSRHGGVGIATRTGLAEALKHKPDAIVFLDADGQHDPRYIPSFIDKVAGGYDFVLGRRDLSRYPMRKRFGNFMLRVLAGIVCPTGLCDPECGFRGISAKAARRLDLRAKNYEICMDFIYNVWKNRLKAAQIEIEVPVYHRKKGTKIRTGISDFWWLLRRRILG